MSRPVPPFPASQQQKNELVHDDLPPGAKVEARPLHFIVIADCSGSMAGAKIASLNNAIADALEAMRPVADEHPEAKVLVRAIAFESSVRWHIASPTPAETATWPALSVGGSTNMAGAIRELAKAVKADNLPLRGLPPVLVLVSDGMPDSRSDYESAVSELLREPWGTKAIRVGIGIGDDADLSALEVFVANPELKPLLAHNAHELVHYLRWVSTKLLQAASRPASAVLGLGPSVIRFPNGTAVPVPPIAPPPPYGVSPQDIF